MAILLQKRTMNFRLEYQGRWNWSGLCSGSRIYNACAGCTFVCQMGSKGSILKKNYTYALIYHSNNPLSQSRPDSETRCFAGTAVLLDENSFIYDGYHFVGWSMTPDDREELLQPGDSCRMPKKDLHLYAPVEKDAKVSLTYHSGIPGQGADKNRFSDSVCKRNRDHGETV